MRITTWMAAGLLMMVAAGAWAQSSSAVAAKTPASVTAMDDSAKRPWDFGIITQGGVGLTEDRDSFRFLMAGVHVGRVVTQEHGKSVLRGRFEYAGEFFPFWQSYTPRFQRANCVAAAQPGYTPVGVGLYCSGMFWTGGTYTGMSLTPILLRWNFVRPGHKLVPWAQGAGGLLWTNHKYPPFGSSDLSIAQDGPATETSVWNFTPQGGVGVRYFVRPNRSVDFGANGIHISSASLGDKNPGINASVQFSLAYSWWR